MNLHLACEADWNELSVAAFETICQVGLAQSNCHVYLSKDLSQINKLQFAEKLKGARAPDTE